uniref:Uncharacterized protein n=1 Tax=Anguilla anguilla TaxID=7936 RepID=A0A0E9WPS7_ANGAN
MLWLSHAIFKVMKQQKSHFAVTITHHYKYLKSLY